MGSAPNRIARSDFLAIPVLLPPLAEQKKIAAVLSSVDQTIESMHAILHQLQVLKKALMSELMTRGLPGRHTRFTPTELGEIPEDWSVRRLGDVARVGNGATPSRQRAEYWHGGAIPWLPTGKVNDRIITFADEFVTQAALDECPIRLLPKGTVLIAMIGQGKTRGKAAYLAMDATVNQNFAYVEPHQALRPWFLFAYLDHQYENLRAGGRGSNQGALNCGIIKAFWVPVPPLKEQEAIEKILMDTEARITAEQQTLTAVELLKSALLNGLLTGDVRVTPDPESP